MEHCSSSHSRTIGKYILEKQIGSGGFSSVYLASNCKTHQKYAVKCIERKSAQQLGLLQYVENELRIYSRLNHPNIAKCYDIVYTEEFIMIVMEFMENGDMQFLINNNHLFRQSDQIRIAIEILEALQYLHSRGISHRDIKPANIMFDSDFHAKLIDFGFCKENASSLHTICGTHLLMAPEIICNTNYDGVKADIWSFAVTMHIMATHFLPFEYESEAQYIRDIKTRNIKVNIRASGIIGWIVKNGMQYEPNDRVSASDMLEYIRGRSSGNKIGMPEARYVRRANTMGQLAKLAIPTNSPFKIRTRVTLDNTTLKTSRDNPTVRFEQH